MKNPFKLEDRGDGPVHVAWADGPPTWGPQQVETLVGVVLAGEPGYQVLLKVAGLLWEPARGARVQLGEPNREATVMAQFYQVTSAGKLASVVLVEDPETYTEHLESQINR